MPLQFGPISCQCNLKERTENWAKSVYFELLFEEVGNTEVRCMGGGRRLQTETGQSPDTSCEQNTHKQWTAVHGMPQILLMHTCVLSAKQWGEWSCFSCGVGFLQLFAWMLQCCNVLIVDTVESSTLLWLVGCVNTLSSLSWHLFGVFKSWLILNFQNISKFFRLHYNRDGLT